MTPPHIKSSSGKIWVIEISTDKGATWGPTTMVGLTPAEATIRKDSVERQVDDLYTKAEVKPIYRRVLYQSGADH